MVPRLLALLFPLLFCLQQQPAPPKVAPLRWEHDFKSACARAAKEQKPILVAVMNDTEAICRRMLEQVYVDPDVAQRLAGFVLVPCSASSHDLKEIEVDGAKVLSCTRFRGVLCSEHQAIERELRDRFTDPGTGAVTVPQHGVLDSKGALLIKRQFAMKRGGFLEFLDGALAIAKGGPAPATPTRSAAVQRLVDTLLRAKTDGEREAAAKDLFADSSAEREAAFTEVLLRAKGNEERIVIVRTAGNSEFNLWAPAIADLLADKDARLRDAAVVTLEEEKNPAVASDLVLLWTTEKDAETRKDLLRALGPAGAGDAAAKKLLLAESASMKETHRVACALSLGSHLAGADDVAAALEERWKKEKSRTVQLALLWGIGASGDRTQVALVDRLTKTLKDEELLRVAEVVRVRLENDDLQAGLRILGRGGRRELQRLLAPIYDPDKVVRNSVRDAATRPGGK